MEEDDSHHYHYHHDHDTTMVDSVLDKLSTLSTQTIHSMDNNIALMNNIISLHNSLTNSKSSSSTTNPANDSTTATLHDITSASNFYTDQLQMMNLRTKYFEAQLNILQAHTTFNALLVSSSSSHNNNTYHTNREEEKDTNWRTTEATLENLYLEYHYHTIKFQEALKGSGPPNNTLNNINNNFDESTPKKKNNSSSSSSTEQITRKASVPILLKPLKTSANAKRHSRILENISTHPHDDEIDLLNDSSMTLLNNTLDITIEEPHQQPQSQPHQDRQPMPVPMPKPKFQHKRSASIPVTPISQVSSDGMFETNKDLLQPCVKNIRHFVSHDTGLDTYRHVSFSFDSSSILIGHGSDGTDDDDDVNSDTDIESMTSYCESIYHNHYNDHNHDVGAEVEPFPITPILKKSASHDSIFETLHTNKETHTHNRHNNKNTFTENPWMMIGQKKIEPIIETSNVTAQNTFKPSSSVPSNTTTATKHNDFLKNFNDFLVHSSSSPQHIMHSPSPPPPPTHFPPHASISCSIPTSSKELLKTVSANNYNRKRREAEALAAANGNSKTGITFEETNLRSQWLQFLSKLKPTSASPTSEIGKPIPIPSAITSSARCSPAVKKKFNSTHSHSYSTITIGPNHSKINAINGMHNNSVLSTRVSHTALNDALTDSPFF